MSSVFYFFGGGGAGHPIQLFSYSARHIVVFTATVCCWRKAFDSEVPSTKAK